MFGQPLRKRTLSTTVRSTAAIVLMGGVVSLLSADFYDTLPPSGLNPAIHYFEDTTEDPIGRLRARMIAGDVELTYQDRAGYLASLLDALDIDVSSQVVVFSKTSLQADLIEPLNPRTIFFNDSVAVGWMGGGMIEVVSQDPVQGIMFYTLRQDASIPARFIRTDNCLGCHEADLGIPGTLVRTQVVSPAGDPLLIYGGDFSDHRTAFDGRWGGWYITGIPADSAEKFVHLGNAMLTDRDNPGAMITLDTIARTSLDGTFDTSGYLSPYSDAAALLVFDHQMHMMNLLVRAGWETRAAMAVLGADDSAENRIALDRVVEDAAAQVADYMLCADEAPLPAAVEDTSGFRGDFMARGPFDGQGRSLRELDLETRLMRYPLSYMIYTEAFDALPDPVRNAIYRRLWETLGNPDSVGGEDVRFAHLTQPVKTAIIEILRETKTDLPAYWLAPAQ